MSMSVFQIGLLTAGLVFLIGGAVLAVIASRIAAAGRAAQTEADIRLAASQELAVEVKRLAEKVEASLAARDAAIENAFLRHNDACMASVQSSLAARASGGHGHDDDDDDDHKKHHSDGQGHDDDDHKHKKHHASSLSGHDDDDDDDDHHKKHHAANDEVGRPSFFARLFRRYP
ncbi:MAG TPA: hypothetical protein DDZ68_16135 [Parvularcula sp.]|nr:hypothetical protein [Parvularcula sp.]HBS32867.1 hypothetical protein [Parvularcula sp.]HBS33564.1 hypothetical protein [Parvularcula sp.]